MPCTSEQASLDEDIDASIEDDEDTAQRPAIKIASADRSSCSFASVSLNGHDNHQTEVVEVRGEDTVVPTRDE